jgi:hypothetical protein
MNTKPTGLAALAPRNLLAFIASRYGSGGGRYYRFGREDNFPNKVVEAVNDSGMARVCIDRLNQFTYGYGFKNKAIGDTRVNAEQKLDQFIRETISYINYLGAFAWVHKYDAFGKIAHSYVLPVQYIRKKIDGGYLYTDGLGDGPEHRERNEMPRSYPAYDPRATPLEIRAEIARQKAKFGEQIGFIQYVYNGGVGMLYEKYAVPTHAAGLNDINANAAHSLQEESIAANSFKAEVVIVTGTIDNLTEDEDGLTAADRFAMEIEKFTSPDGSPVMHIQKNQEQDVQVFPLDTSNSREEKLDRSRERVEKVICRLFHVPPIIAGISTEGKLGDNQELVNQLKLFHLTLADKKELLLRGLKDRYPETPEEDFDLEALNLFSFLPSELLSKLSEQELRDIYDLAAPVQTEPLDEKIASRFAEFGVGGVQGILGIQTSVADKIISEASAIEVLKIIYGFTEEQALKVVGGSPVAIDPATGQPAPVAPVAEETKLNEAFTNLTGRQLQGIQRIVRKFSREELTEAQASQLLQSGFGMTDEQAKVWLITQEEEDNGTV